jgi:hypothetical protein
MVKTNGVKGIRGEDGWRSSGKLPGGIEMGDVIANVLAVAAGAARREPHQRGD